VTYRFVPQKLLRFAQLLTLLVTAIIGVGIALTPPDTAVTLSQIEQAMNADVWAYSMSAVAVVTLLVELWANMRDDATKLMPVVAYGHLILCGLFVGYGVSALVGVILRTPWAFASPSLAILLAFWHFLFARRRPHI
jgi:hypothetical protein